MENKRGSSGFIGTAVGVVMTIIQSTHPEWLGNHPWILPVSLLLLFIGLLFWLTQIPRVQKILGISFGGHVDLPKTAPKKNDDEIAAIKQMHAEELHRHEITHNAELERARECYEQCKLAVFSPLQMEAFCMAKDLLKFLSDFEPMPPLIGPGNTDRDKITNRDQRSRWRERFNSGFALRLMND